MEVPYLVLALWAGFIIVADLPAVSCPAAMSREGLPIGVQVVTAHYHERMGLEVARVLERCHRRFQPPPVAVALAGNASAKL